MAGEPSRSGREEAPADGDRPGLPIGERGSTRGSARSAGPGSRRDVAVLCQLVGARRAAGRSRASSATAPAGDPVTAARKSSRSSASSDGRPRRAIDGRRPRHVAQQRDLADEVARDRASRTARPSRTPRARRPSISVEPVAGLALADHRRHPPRPRRGTDAARRAPGRGPERAEDARYVGAARVRSDRPAVAVRSSRRGSAAQRATPPPAAKAPAGDEGRVDPDAVDEDGGDHRAERERRPSTAPPAPRTPARGRRRRTLRCSSVRDATSKKLVPIPATTSRSIAGAGPLTSASNASAARRRTPPSRNGRREPLRGRRGRVAAAPRSPPTPTAAASTPGPCSPIASTS